MLCSSCTPSTSQPGSPKNKTDSLQLPNHSRPRHDSGMHSTSQATCQHMPLPASCLCPRQVVGKRIPAPTHQGRGNLPWKIRKVQFLMRCSVQTGEPSIPIKDDPALQGNEMPAKGTTWPRALAAFPSRQVDPKSNQGLPAQLYSQPHAAATGHVVLIIYKLTQT